MVEKLKQINITKQFITNALAFGFFVLILSAALAFGMAVSKANAANGINKSINYQGKLMYATGTLVNDGDFSIKFTLYDSALGGTQLWSASTTNGLPGGTPASVSVAVVDGLFSVLLGDATLGHVAIPETIFNNDNVYLGITIGADSEMQPRKRLSAVPYAFNAGALQGQKASSTISSAGGELFKLSQNSTDSAVATRTALLIESLGTSNQYDYLLRLSNGTSDVFTINRQGNTTTTGSLSVADFLSVQGIRLDATGTSQLTSGAYLVGVYDEFIFSNATTVQATLKDLDTTIGLVSSTANNLTLQNVTDNGNSTTNPILFAGGTSTGDLMPGAHLTYDLGRPGMRWDELFVRKVRIGTDSWDLETDANNTFLLSEVTNGNFFAITENGKVGIGTSTPQFFTLEVNGTIGPAQNNLFDLGSGTMAWRNITAVGTVSSTNAVFGSVDAESLSVTNLSVGNQLDLSELVWTNSTGTNTVLGNLTVTSTLLLPNDSVTDAMASDSLTIGELGNVSATSINSGVLGNSNVVLSLDTFGSVTGRLSASQISIASINMTNSLDLQSYLNMLMTNGRAFGGETIQTASGTVMVTAGEGLIASDPTNPGATVYHTTWATSTGIDVPFFEWLNIYLHYNAGNPIIVATTTDYTDDWTYFKIAKVFNEGDGTLHIHDERSVETRPINRIVDFLENGIGQTVTSGCEISGVGTRNIAVSQCTNWYSAYERTIPAFDSSVADTFDIYRRDGLGGYIHQGGQQQWNNLYYDDNSGTLQALGGDEYGVHWVYIHEHGTVSLLYGQNAYSDLSNAQVAQPPADLPDEFLDSEHAFLIGAIIFKQGQDTVEAIRDLRPVIIDRDGVSSGGLSIINHNELSGLQGGTADEYYHLTATGFDADANLLFSANNGGTFGLEVNDINNKKITINNTFAGSASLDIVDGNLMLASTTRITNAGAGYLTNLNLSGSLYVSGTTLLTTLTADSATSTNLFATNANFTNLTAGVFGVTDLTWVNATGTYANIDNITGTIATFDNLIATSATFTNVVVMENTNIENLTFGNATGGNLVTYGQVSSTYIYVLESELGHATAHNMVVDETLRVGIGEFPIVGDSVAQFGGTVDSYLQVNLQNHSSGTNASADYIVTADIGDDESYYVDLGINSSNYSNPDFSITGPLDAYLYSYSADLTIGTATSSSVIKFHTGGTEATDEVMRITSDHYVGIGTTTPAHTLDVDGDGQFTGLLTLSSATTSELFWGSATGTNLSVSGIATLSANTTIGGQSVCLLDGTNCPSTTSPDFQTVTNTGNSTTNWIEFAGGTSTAAIWLQAGLTVDGYGDFQDIEFVNASGTNLLLSGLVSSTSLISGDAVLANTTMANATATNLNVETLKVGSGNFPVLGASLAQFGGDFNNYLVVNARNTNTGDFASSNFTASADVATPGNNYNTTMGVANSGFNNVFFSIANPLDSYFMGNSNDLIIVSATSSSVIKFAAGGTAAVNEVMRITSDHYVGIGTTTPSHTLDVDGDGQFTGLLTLSSATTSELFWGSATGTNLSVSGIATLSASTTIGGQSVCLLDGTNCPSGTSPDLQTVTNTGNTTTHWIEFAGGTSTADFWFQQGLTIDGHLAGQTIDFTDATGSSLILSGIVSSTGLISGDAVLANTVMENATATNLIIETLKVGSGNFPVLGASLAQFGGDFNNYLVVNARNTNTGDFASANFTASADVATPGNTFNTTMGVANSGFNNAFFSIANPLDSYFMGNSNDLLIVAATSSSIIKFAAGGTTAANEVMRITSDHYVGIGTTTPAHTLDVDGDGRFTGLLTLSSATTSELFWGSATGTNVSVSGATKLSLNTTINGVGVCLSDGTNCPSSAASNLQTVTNAGNTTTHALQFAGGTSTADFRFQSDVWIDGNVSSTSALFINATGTNLAVLGYINSNLMPMTTDAYYLGDATHRWQGLTVNYVTSTNILATGYVSTSAMYINGRAVTTSVPTLDQVTTQGNVTANTIQFAGGTSTGSLLPGTTDLYSLGSNTNRWKEIFGNSVFVGTSTPWSLTELANNDFAISNNGAEKMRMDNAGNLLFAASSYVSGLDNTFAMSGNDAFFADKVGIAGSIYAGTDLRVGATSTVYGKSSLYKQDGGDYLFQFADAVAAPDSITGFEGSFPPAGWTTGGNANWLQDASTSTEGTYSVTNGDIIDNQISWLETTYVFSGNGVLEFDWRVSSEATYDFLMFCLDNSANCSEVGGGYNSRISGETNFVTVSIPISAGSHTLRWAYEKDYSISEGSDAGWVDNVRFTPYSGQNWRFYTANTERLTIAYSGNVGVGIADPESKLDINGETKARGNVTVTPAPSKTEVAWSTANIPATGIEAVRSLVTYNGYLYAGQGDSAGDGDIQICNPAGGGSATLCDNSADWSASYGNATYSQVLSMIVYKGRLYAGFGDGGGLGDVMVCNPATTGGADTCDAGDWSSANFPAGPDRITQLIEYNGYLYAANDTGVSGSASVAICNPAGGGDTTACDNVADWTNNTLPINYEEVNSMVVHLNTLYAFVGNSTDDSDTFYCTPSLAGNVNTCDSSSDWVRPFDNTTAAYESAYSAAVYNGYLYLGRGLSNGDGDVDRCEHQAAGDDLLCDNAGDWTTVIDNPSQVQKITAMMSYDGSLYIGQEGSTSNGNVIEFTGSNYKISHNVSGLEAVYSFAVLNGVLYSGRGNSTGDGQVYYYQKARESSYALKMEAGSSTGSMWFSSESLNYQGVGTSYDAQTGVFKFSHGIITEAGAYDLAEMYPTLDTSIASGDVVVLDAQNAGYVKKSEKSYEKSLLGVVSTKPGFLLSGKEKGIDSRAIALVGRVPVNVSLENGDIEVGDPLTSANLEGYAMKATKPGMIIGHAMEALSASSTAVTSTDAIITTGKVIMVVQPGYYFGNQETALGQIAGFLGETTTTQIVQQAFDGDAYAIEQIAGGMVNPQIADGSSLNEVSSAQLDVLIVRTAVLIAGDLTVGGDSKLLGHVIVSNETAGVVDLPAGDNYVEIQFATPFENVPVVVVTPESDAQEFFNPWLGKFRIAKKTVNGFRIEVDEGACMDPTNCGRTMKFNWIAVGVMPSEISTSTAVIATPTTTEVVVEEVVIEPTQEDGGTVEIVEPGEDQIIVEEVVLPDEVSDQPIEESPVQVDEPAEIVPEDVETFTESEVEPEPEVILEPVPEPVPEPVIEAPEVSVE
ncbi:MAG: hypothetical protein P1P90_05905 [Patescibacteria group bacterium]|nr:hypothetical protein [Patescibacteria group bacterium]